ncbi:MAG: MATE family efflux transporter [Isosphaeraceae bacterium]|nr:MATE family efflux transporter [Isosphaeraceae bacterium]
MSTAAATTSPRALPPVLGRLLSGTFWLALRTPLQAVCTLWTTRLILQAIGPDQMGAYKFAWGFGFFQFLFEFGISSALQRQISDSWTRDDREGVDRAIACGTNFYAAMAVAQAAALLAVAYGALPFSQFRGDPAAYTLIVKLLWLQAVTAPCYGISVVASSVLQAARRYDFIPRLELLVVILRFALLVVGVYGGFDFFLIVAGQTAIQIGLTLGPALWVMKHALGHVPHFRGARLADWSALLHISFFMSLMQLSVVLADRIDTTMLGFLVPDPGQANAVYDVVSKPFVQIRQTGWMLSYMVMPAVASLAAAADARGLDRIKYDGTRLHVGLLLPIALLAWLYAAPFLSLWVGDRLGYNAATVAPLMRLFLIATLPLVLSVLVQTAIGIGKIRFVALSALAGSLVNLPISYILTLRLGVAGVIWGTVLTTLFSNLLAPGIYVFRVLDVRPSTFFTRTLSAPLVGAAALLAATGLVRALLPIPAEGSPTTARLVLLLAHLTLGSVAYIGGYLALPAGRGDLTGLASKLRRRRAE